MSLLKYRKYTFQGIRTIKVPTVVALVNGAGHPLDAADTLQVAADGGGDRARTWQQFHVGVWVGGVRVVAVVGRRGAVVDAKVFDSLLGFKSKRIINLLKCIRNKAVTSYKFTISRLNAPRESSFKA